MSKNETYRHYLPSNSKWMAEYADKMGHKPFMTYLNRVYVRLNNMAVGSTINIDLIVTNKQNLDLFIKCACDFIQQASKLNIEKGKYTHCFEFSDDFKTIKRQ